MAVKVRFLDAFPDKPQPGDMFFVRHHGGPSVCHHWDNCDDAHLHVILPNGHWWDIDSRASNCTLKNDRTHRCWIRHGDPRTGNVHVDKAGTTCSAGAGSILAGDYHGFLHNSELTPS